MTAPLPYQRKILATSLKDDDECDQSAADLIERCSVVGMTFSAAEKVFSKLKRAHNTNKNNNNNIVLFFRTGLLL